MAYQGNVATFPIGQDGLTGNDNLVSLRPTQLVQAINVAYANGVVQKIGGAAKWNTTRAVTDPNEIVKGLYWWAETPAIQARVFFYVRRSIRVSVEGAPNAFGTYLSGIAEDVNPVFVEAGKEVLANQAKLFLFNGVDRVHVCDGNATAFGPISQPPADWAGTNQPNFGVVHEGRMWGGGNNNDPHRIYYSTTTDHEDFVGTGAGSLSVYPGEGTKLIGGIVFKGLLILFKFPRGVYVVDARNADVANWTVERISGAVGGVSPNAIVGIGDDDAVLWLDSAGNFRVAAGVLEFGNVSTNNLSRIQDFSPYFRRNVNLGRLARVQGVYYEHKEQAQFVISEKTATVVNNRRIIIDFNQQPPKFSVVDRDINDSIALRRGPDNIARPLIGDDDATAWTLDEDARNKDGAAYDGIVEIPPSNLGFLDPAIAYREKNGQYLEVVMDKAETAEVTYTWDYDRFYTITVQANQRHRILDGGKWFGAEIRQSGLNQDFHPAALRLYFTLGPER